MEGYLLFVFLSFGFWFLLVDCYMVHCPSFASLPTSERQNLDLAKRILTADQINFIYYNELLKLTKLFVFEKINCQKTIFVFCLKKKTVLSSIYSHYKFFSSIIFTICFYLIKTLGILKPFCFYV